MSRDLESEMRRKWFSIGIAISLSAATFASPINTSMEQDWTLDGNGKRIPINYALPASDRTQPDQAHREYANLSRVPWSGPWWRTKVGSIAVRWRLPFTDDALTYTPYSADDLANLSDDDITNLSPVEKLDIVSGHTDPSSADYYTNLAGVRSFVSNTLATESNELGYHGLCAGFSSASLWLSEPNPVNIPAYLKLSNGQTVTRQVLFGSADMKALATYWYAEFLWTPEAMKPVLGGVVGLDGELNPAQIHLLLTNLVRGNNQGFVMNINSDGEVWNFPVAGYSTSIDGSSNALSGDDPLAVKAIHVTTRIYFMGESVPDENALGSLAYTPSNSEFYQLISRDYSYNLELTADNQIVGGTWDASSDRPGTAWTLKRAIPFTGDYAIVGRYWQ